MFASLHTIWKFLICICIQIYSKINLYVFILNGELLQFMTQNVRCFLNYHMVGYWSRATPNMDHLSLEHGALMPYLKMYVLFPTVCCSVHLLPADDATGVRGPARGHHPGEPQTASSWHFLEQNHTCQGEEEAAQRVWKASPRGLPPASLQHLLKHATEGYWFDFLVALHKVSLRLYGT